MPLALCACYFEVKDGCYFMGKINIFRIWQGFQVLLETTEVLDCTCAAMVIGWFLGNLCQSWTEPMTWWRLAFSYNIWYTDIKLSFRFLIDLKQKQKSNCLKKVIIIPSPTKLRRDIVTLPSVRPPFCNILVNTLESTSFNGFWPNLVHT